MRPGPIQGGMVHPYLRRRDAEAAGHKEASRYPALDAALGRTLGVPIFQEQVMQICVIAADFTPGEADGLRRAMAAWRRDGHVDKFEQRIKQGMAQKGYDAGFADAIFKQICGFGEYGFPESHAASFALLAYVSLWMKCHEPAIFLAAPWMPCMVWTTSPTASPPRVATVAASPARVLAWAAWSAFCLTIAVSSCMLEAVCSRLAAWASVRADRSALPAAISREVV